MGMMGRDLPAKGRGMVPGSVASQAAYVSGYKNEGSYGKKNNPFTICKTQQTNARFRCAEISSPIILLKSCIAHARSEINDVIINLVT